MRDLVTTVNGIITNMVPSYNSLIIMVITESCDQTTGIMPLIASQILDLDVCCCNVVEEQTGVYNEWLYY